MKLRKSLLWLLVLLMVLSVTGVAVSATTMQTPTHHNRETIPFQVNPAYADIYTPEDLAPLLQTIEEETKESGHVGQQMPALQTGDAVYLPMEEAAVLLREKMEDRQAYIEVFITSPNKDYNQLIAQTVDVALLHTGDPTEGDYLRWHFGGWEGEVEWDKEGENYLYKFELDMLYYTSAEQEAELDEAMDGFIASLELDGKSDYEKVLAVYDYICKNVDYDYTHLHDAAYTLKNSAYAALFHKTAVCQGYANLFYRLMLEMGIDCRVIAGDAKGPHAWNIVKLGEVYYNLDSTWDSEKTKWKYFLQNSEGFADHYRFLDYATTQFHTDYPMSATDYVDGVEGEPENVYVAGICGKDAYWTLGRDRVLTITGYGATDNYNYNSQIINRPEWELWGDAFDTVVVEKGITALGDCLFAGTESIVKAELPDKLKIIGMQTFADCTNLSQLTLGEGLEDIGWNAFTNCALVEVTLPSTVEAVNGFSDNHGLTTVNILAQSVAFGDEAFRNCENLVNMELPQETTWIGSYTFAGCGALESVTIPETVTELGTHVFEGCKNLKKAVVNSDCGISDFAFNQCENLETVELNGATEKIGNSAFYGCAALQEMCLPETLTALGSQCFEGCTGLQKVYFNGDEPLIGENAFSQVTLTVCYPKNNPTWVDTLENSYGGQIVWEAYCDHDYATTSTMTSCIHNNETVYTCTKCGDSYREIFRYATGHHTYSDEQDTVCDVCGGTRDLNMPTTPMYRLYNQNSGEHFYTGSVEERDVLISVGWQYEGIAWNAPTKHGAPVYRLYNPNNGDHHYTMSIEERDMLSGIGWQYEGVAWNSASPSNLPMYRLFNPNADCGSHHYTGSKEEREYLVSLGWQYEGVGWHGMLH